MSIHSLTPAVLDRNLALEVVRVTEASALAAARQTGRGNEQAADEAACAAMLRALNAVAMTGLIVNGEGDDVRLPLHTGEKVGTGKGPRVDVILTALEGRSICARGASNALSVVAMTEEGSFLKVPQHCYMEKVAVGPGVPPGLIDLDHGPEETLRRIAQAKGVAVGDLTVSVLDRPRHVELIERLIAAGARVMLFDDGDVSGALAAALSETTGIDVYMGSGGAAQGVLAAAGLKCLGGQMQGRLMLRSEQDRAQAHRAGLTEPGRKWTIDDMVKGEVMFAATGITDGHVLKGARLLPGQRAISHSLVMRSRTGTIRYLTVHHDLTRIRTEG